jgi:hypothetical protein
MLRCKSQWCGATIYVEVAWRYGDTMVTTV